jgi:tetratricopeptide (TPR) repeat protein
MDNIIDLVNRHKYDEALVIIEELLKTESDENFYELLMLKSTVLVKLGKYEQVLEILEEELAMPYIPMEVEKELHMIYDFAVSMMYQDEVVHKPLEDDELIDNLLNSENQNLVMASLQQLYDRNIRKYMTDLKRYLANPKSNPLFQSMVLEIMMEQEINSLVRVSKNKHEIDVIPSELTPVLESNFVMFTNAFLEETMFKEPSLYKVAQELLHTYAYVIYPDTDDLDNMLIAAAIHGLAMNYQGQVIDMGVLSLMYQYDSEIIEEIMIEIENLVTEVIPKY